MHELQLDKAVKHHIKDHQYYVFPTPPTHTNQVARPTKYADQKVLKTYTGKGNNGKALLHPDAFGVTDRLMTAMLEYGEHIDDHSMRSAVVKSGWRPDDPSQGGEYLRILKDIVSSDPKLKGLVFPVSLEAEARSKLGGVGNPRLGTFKKHVAESPGWTQELANHLFVELHGVYSPQGFNAHATGFVLDLNWWVHFPNGSEDKLNANAKFNVYGLQSAAGMWLNTYASLFCFDSYDTNREIWHQEYRQCGPPSISRAKVPFTA